MLKHVHLRRSMSAVYASRVLPVLAVAGVVSAFASPAVPAAASPVASPASVAQSAAPAPATTPPPSPGSITPESISIGAGPVCNATPGGQTVPVSIKLPFPYVNNNVDVSLLLDDTGSFSGEWSAVSATFKNVVDQLQADAPGVTFGFGVSMFKDYGGAWSNEDSDEVDTRPYILNQPIITAATAGGQEQLATDISDAASRADSLPGYGGDGPESALEGLYQLATGSGFDGNGNGSTQDSGAAGDLNTQTNPGLSGDVPSFATNTAPTSGSLGGIGWRPGALHLVILATDVSTAAGFPAGSPIPSNVTAHNGDTEPSINFSSGYLNDDGSGDGARFGHIANSVDPATNTEPGAVVPKGGAGVQQTVDALNALGIRVIGMGPGAGPTSDPGPSYEPSPWLSSMARLTGAVGSSGTPLVFDTSTNANTLAASIVDNVEASAANAVDVTMAAAGLPAGLTASFAPSVVDGVTPGGTANFDVTITGKTTGAKNGTFDLKFLDGSSGAELGSIPVTVTCPNLATSLSARPALLQISPLETDLFNLSATLSAGGDPLPGQTLVFTAKTTRLCTAVTSPTGNAVCKIITAPTAVLAAVEQNGYTVTFAGNGAYQRSSATATLLKASPPRITGVTPAAGPKAGNTSVTIAGSGFTGATAVAFGPAGSALAFTVVSDGKITAKVPAYAAGGTVNIVVTTPAGSSPVSAADTYRYAAVPTITSVSPSSGSTTGGTTVTITGTGLTGASEVKFGAAGPATGFTVVSDTQISAVTPAYSVIGDVPLSVTTPGGTTSGSSGVTYHYAAAPPTITAVSPGSGPAAGGTTVTISGSGFSGATGVSFGGTAAAAFSVDSSTQITATSPAHSAGTVHVSVTTPFGTSAGGSADQFTFVTAPPAVTSVSPSAGPTAGGTTVTIIGSGFTGATSVQFSSATPAAAFTVISDTKITATSPAHSAATVHVFVTTPAGVSTATNADKFTYQPPPAVTGVSPNTGPAAGGTTVTLTGTGFTGATKVQFSSSTSATSFTVVSDTKITVTAPPHAAATVNIFVTTPSGVSTAVAADKFTYT